MSVRFQSEMASPIPSKKLNVISLINIIENLHSVKILKNTRILKDSITKRVSTKAFRMRWALINTLMTIE
jgi:hypothetical protein